MGIFTEMGNGFEASISSLVQSSASGVIGMVTPLLLIGVTLYFTITGYMIMAGRISEPLSDVMIKGAKIALVAMVGLSTGSFMSYVVNGAHELEASLLSAIGANGSVYQVLDKSWETSSIAISTFFEMAGDLNFMTNFSEIVILFLAGVLGLIGLVAMCFIAAGIIMTAKIALVVVLGLGPLFVCALMFPVTAGWFDSWLRTVLNYVLTTVIVATFLLIFIDIYLGFMTGMSEFMTANANKKGVVTEVLFHSVITLLIALVSCFAMLQAPTISAGLAGGVAISAISLTSMAGKAFGKESAIAGAGRMTSKAASTAGKASFGMANIATRGGAERASKALTTHRQNIASRYFKRDNSMSG